MATSFDIDIVIDVYRSSSTSTSIGTKSPYAKIPYPATGNIIKGWEWDKRTWPSDIEIKATDFAPSIFDPSKNFIPEEKFQSGIGDNNDLLLVSVNEEQASNIRYWTPRINHGYFYMHDEEWYLYSDDAVRDLFDATLTSGVLQYKDLEFKPKPGVPVSARRYKWNNDKARYELFLSLSKKLDFTGIVTSGNEADTFASGNYITSSIDASKKEFVLEYDSDPNRVVLNQDYRDQIGTSGNLTSLEFLGISDGITNEYHLPYAPVDPSGVVQLITWDERNGSVTYPWTRINTNSEFTVGGLNEFKLDNYLGIITFGDYDTNTGSGAGARPGTLHQIGMVYTRGLELIYEPEYTRDWIEPRPGDVNPFHNPINQGFIKVTSQTSNPSIISLSADMDGDAINGYNIDLSNKTGKLTAIVYDSLGERMEGETVTFEVLNPQFGTFSNLDTEAQSLSSVLGEASTEFVPPTSIDDIGIATTTVAPVGADTLITAEGMIAPDRVEDIYLYKVMVDDPVQGILVTDENTFYEDFLTAEGIVEDPDGTSATPDFEKDYRDENQLLKPKISSLSDLATGSKVLVAAIDVGVIDPNYFVQDSHDSDYTLGETSAPLIPYSKLTSGGSEVPSLEVTYSGTLDAPDNTTFKAYFLVCPATTRIRAKVINKFSGKTVYSNVVSITINIPDNASGVSLINDINDLQQDVRTRVKHIDEVSDSTILESEDELESEWLEDKLSTTETRLTHWSSDSHTIGYWPLESGSLHDSSRFGNDLLNMGGMITAAGIVGGGYRSTIPGTPQWLDASNLYREFSLQSGTIDFAFRTGSNTPSGTTSKLFEFTMTGTNQLRNSLQGYYQQTAQSGILFRFNYEVSGVGNPNAYLIYPLLDSGIILTDSEWHTIRVSWAYDYTLSQITLAGQIDNQLISDGFPTAILDAIPIIGTVSGGLVEAIVGDLSASGDFFFDEIRYSDSVRTDEWVPEETVTSGESFVDWFRRSRKADTNRLLLQNMVASGYAPARLPLGFRLKSTGITVASMLDRVTFVTTNTHLPSDYFDEE